MSDKSAKSNQGPGSSSKPRRKISLPWFRQTSVNPHAALSRQHTIDTPGSLRYKSFDRTASQVCSFLGSLHDAHKLGCSLRVLLTKLSKDFHESFPFVAAPSSTPAKEEPEKTLRTQTLLAPLTRRWCALPKMPVGWISTIYRRFGKWPPCTPYTKRLLLWFHNYS